MRLNKDEKELLTSFEKGEWKSVENAAVAKKYFQKVAVETMRKDRRINVLLS